MFNWFKRRKQNKINTLYKVVCDIFKEQEEITKSPEIPYFIKARSYVKDCIKNGLLEEKYTLFCKKA